MRSGAGGEGRRGVVLCQKITFQLERMCGRYKVLLGTPARPLWLRCPIPPIADSLGPDYRLYPRTVQSPVEGELPALQGQITVPSPGHRVERILMVCARRHKTGSEVFDPL